MEIKDIISRNIVTGSIYNTVDEIAILMKKYNTGFIPITKEGKIVGVITDRDIVIKSVINKDYKLHFNTTIYSININSSIDEALDIMKNKKVKRLIVIDNNKKIIGILSISDILNHYDSNKIIETLKSIYEIKDTERLPVSEIDEFYL